MSPLLTHHAVGGHEGSRSRDLAVGAQPHKDLMCTACLVDGCVTATHGSEDRCQFDSGSRLLIGKARACVEVDGLLEPSARCVNLALAGSLVAGA